MFGNFFITLSVKTLYIMYGLYRIVSPDSAKQMLTQSIRAADASMMILAHVVSGLIKMEKQQ